MRKRFLFPILAFLFVSALCAQEVLNNDSIVKLVKAGLTEDTIVSIVKTQPGKYSLSTDDVINLHYVGVSEKIISAMVNKGPAGSGTPSKEASAPALPADVGVYWKKMGIGFNFCPKL